MKKRLLTIMITTIVMSVILIGCGGNNASKNDTTATNKTTEASKEPTKPADASKDSAKTTDVSKETAKPTEVSTKGTSTSDGNSQDFVEVPVTIENGTDVDFSELYTSGTKVEDWGDNLIGSGVTFASGDSIKATFNVDVDNLKWDFKAVDKNGDYLEFDGLDLSNCNSDGIKIKLLYNRDTQTGTITAE